MYFFQLSNDTSYFSINEHEIPFILALEEFYKKNEENHVRCLELTSNLKSTNIRKYIFRSKGKILTKNGIVAQQGRFLLPAF